MSASAFGSSPLARGLHAAVDGMVRKWRIIPARAGFTCTPRTTGKSWRDHPRSRGVYARRSACSALARGSSPLARGLPPGPQDRARGSRIIPARAGFTSRPGASWTTRRDHPRSRGVYGGAPDSRGWYRGSSPLARGLRLRVRSRIAASRIIPARAGFTHNARRNRGEGRDHPRSRGVYIPRPGPNSSSSGSSPLARGLHRDEAGGGHRVGIIPARAGFTPPDERRSLPDEDHPRSRGVYSPPPKRGSHGLGSSPLARGLRVGGGHPGAQEGIIPARAGFTPR